MPSTVVMEKTLESPLDCKEIKPVNPKGNQSWIFIGRTHAEAETPILWPPNAKNWLLGKDPDAGKDWGQEEKRMTEDEMVGWHHWLDGHEFEQALGVGDGQGSLACCSPWHCKESVRTEWMNWTYILHNVLQKTEEEEIFPNSFYEASITLVPKLDNDSIFIKRSVWTYAQSCPTLCDSIDCSLPGFSVHGIFLAWILEWVAISFSRGSS